MTLEHIVSITGTNNKVLAVYPVSKQNEQNVECSTPFGKITVWDNNKVVFRGLDGKMKSINLEDLQQLC